MRLFWLVSLLMTTAATAQQIERTNPEGMTQPTAYSHLVKVGNLMFLAGQVALDGEGNVVGAGDMKSQVRQVLENMKSVLASEGADFSNVVKINIFTTDIEAFRGAASALAVRLFSKTLVAGRPLQRWDGLLR